MRCSLSLLETNELGKAEVLLELAEKVFVEDLVSRYVKIFDPPKLWPRIKNVFKPIPHEPMLRAILTETLNSFKANSAKAHLGQSPNKPRNIKVAKPPEGTIL